MIRPEVLASDRPFGPWSCRGRDIWAMLCAAREGDAPAVRRLLERDPDLYRAEYAYTQPIHLAVREGHPAAVATLLEAGADPATVTLDGDTLLTLARDRGHDRVAQVLEAVLAARGAASPSSAAAASTPGSARAAAHPVFEAAEADDAPRIDHLLNEGPEAVHHTDRAGGTPLHRAVAAGAQAAVSRLIERGAYIHALHGTGPGSEQGYAATAFQPIDLALWSGPFWNVRGDLEMARLLVHHGATVDLTIASALGDLEAVQRILERAPDAVNDERPCGKRALSTAIDHGHDAIARLLLERGADPNAPEGATAPRGVALHAASRTGNQPMVELLLSHGADPNGEIDSSGSATYAAQSREIRQLLLDHGGSLDPYDLVWLGEEEEAVRRVRADPASAHAGCGGVLAAACSLGKRDLVERLLEAGARVAPVVNGCRSYLLTDPDLLRLLLASGMDPDLPSWQHVTPLHTLSSRDSRGRPHPNRQASAEILLGAGANIDTCDEIYRSTPLAWAARNGLGDMVALLLDHGANIDLPDSAPWATPRAWAERRGHHDIVELLDQKRPES